MSSRNDARVPYPINGGTQTASFTGTSAAISTAFDSQTRRAVFYSTQDCHLHFATAPTATTADFFLPASVSMMLAVRPGEKVAAIRGSADGTLYVSEVTY